MLRYSEDKRYIIQKSNNGQNYVRIGPYSKDMLPAIKNSDDSERLIQSIPKPHEQTFDLYPNLRTEFIGFIDSKYQSLTLKDIREGCNYKAEFKCNICDHKWVTVIEQRTRNKRQCPFCCKMSISFPEKYLFYSLRQIDQELIENYKLPGMHGIELDMYNPHKNYAIEFSQQFFHSERIDIDEEKYQLCLNNKIRLIQIYQVHSEKQVRKINDNEYIIPAKSSINGVSDLNIVIDDICEQYSLDQSLINRKQAQDQAFIRTNKIPPEGESLLDKFPDICRDWDYSKNGVIHPEMLKSAQQIRVQWKCIYCGREWEAYVNNRTSKLTSHRAGCKSCNRKIGQGLMKEIPYIPDNKSNKT